MSSFITWHVDSTVPKEQPSAHPFTFDFCMGLYCVAEGPLSRLHQEDIIRAYCTLLYEREQRQRRMLRRADAPLLFGLWLDAKRVARTVALAAVVGFDIVFTRTRRMPSFCNAPQL
eukprot:TRINITY_DN9806_c0_g1_i4.p3 TRINITY_DN9806_c0_g1~~TRINITY_DN9806_c0_g1_i4.p3  ORF type:complete len:116 (+),score=7.37 TRINITY_DN9806_c0_g1_i4:708-1055(+)